jgi:N-acetylglucosamine-6-sulfatase
VRIQLLRWGTAALAGAALGMAAHGAQSQPAARHGALDPRGRPNVVVVETDDQTLEEMRFMSNVNALLASQGTTFSNSFVSYSLCCPSRSTFLTGQYAHNHGVMDNKPPNGGFYKLDSSNTLAVWLQKAGYYTVELGKYLNGYGTKDPRQVPPGWSEWHGLVDPSTYRYSGYTVNESGTLVTYGTDPGSYQTDVLAGKADEIIRRRAPEPQPFFLWVTPLAPHAGGPRDPDDPPGLGTPSPPPRYHDRFATLPLPRTGAFNEADVSDKPLAVRRRPAMGAARIAAVQDDYQQRAETLLAADDLVAKVYAALRDTGELDDTLIVFTSDNGFMQGEHRIPSGKVVVYEPSIRVPLVMRGPGVPRGTTVGNLVANIDVAPTILDATRALADRPVDGRSLFPIMRDSGLEWGRDILLETRGYSGIRTRRYKYVEYATGERELYDLRLDPNELRNRASDASYRHVHDELAARLHSLRTCSARGCRTRPHLALSLRYDRRRLPSGRTCSDGSVRATLHGSDARGVEFVDFSIDRRRVARDGRSPFTRLIARSRLGSGGSLSIVRALADLRDGRAVSVDRGVRAC